MLYIIEGLRFLRAITPRWRLLPTREYLHWRLGTMYRSFDEETGAPRPLRDLLVDLWKDRPRVVAFLTWRRKMRLSAARKRR